MQKISKLAFKTSAQSSNIRSVLSGFLRVQPFSIQTDMQSFDFTDKLNVEELKLKNPQNT
jgi:hypothetical protein